jgi:hypothetical protein
VAEDLGLDDNERELLEAFDPPSSVRSAIDRLAADSLEAHQLVAMLVLAEHAEHASRPWSAPIEVPSQQRAARGPAPMGRYVTTEALPEERLGPIVRPRPVAARPATPERPQPRVAPDTAADDYAFAAPSEESAARPPSAPQRPPSAPQRAPSAPQQRPASAPQPRAAAPSPAPAVRRPEPEPASPVRRPPEARPRRLGAALKRLGKELETRRAHTQQLVPDEVPTGTPAKPSPGAPAQAAAGAAPAAATPAEANAVRELIRRRRAMVSQQARATTEKKPQPASPAELMRSAQDALRDQQFGRAQELLARACEAEPSNDIYKMFRLWAAFRANALQEGDLTTFKTLVREKMNDDLHKGFAYYAMGHVMLVEKKDDNAEKFFRKAMELDKTNKDAERHVRLLELRKKSAASDNANNKIFGIEIGKKS